MFPYNHALEITGTMCRKSSNGKSTKSKIVGSAHTSCANGELSTFPKETRLRQCKTGVAFGYFLKPSLVVNNRKVTKGNSPVAVQTYLFVSLQQDAEGSHLPTASQKL